MASEITNSRGGVPRARFERPLAQVVRLGLGDVLTTSGEPEFEKVNKIDLGYWDDLGLGGIQ